MKRYHDLFCLYIHILVSGLSSKQKRQIVYPLLSTFLSLRLLVEAADRKVSSLPPILFPAPNPPYPSCSPNPWPLFLFIFTLSSLTLLRTIPLIFMLCFFFYALHFSFQFLHFPLVFVSSVTVFAVAAVQVILPAFHRCGWLSSGPCLLKDVVGVEKEKKWMQRVRGELKVPRRKLQTGNISWCEPGTKEPLDEKVCISGMCLRGRAMFSTTKSINEANLLSNPPFIPVW